jgi:hypothetical protein
LPVVSLKLAAFLSRITTEYVSCRNIEPSINVIPESIDWSQNIHLQPLFSDRHPPIKGPMVGPRRGPIPQIAIAAPLRSVGNMSPIVAPPSVIGMEPAQPAKKRKAMSMPRESLTAQHMMRMQMKRFPRIYTGRRPYTSERGAAIKGPKANPRMKMDTTKVSK